MREQASILHLDLDAFFAAVEQRDKPSLRGKPVIVGGTGGRGVVATASYEARAFGVRSAMSTREARSRCPHAAFLSGRFEAYRESSRAVMGVLRAASPAVEPLSLDEAFVDLAVPGTHDLSVDGVRALGERLKHEVYDATGGLHASVGIASSKLIAKIASELDKPDGLVVVEPGTEQDLIAPMKAGVIPGVGPATVERLRRAGLITVEDVRGVSLDELVRLLGQAHGQGLYRLSRADDDRTVSADRETKSISVEDTYETDVADPRLLEGLVGRHATTVAERLRKAKLSGRTVTVKMRSHDFSTHTRSATRPAPTDDVRTIVAMARRLLGDMVPDGVSTGGVRLLGVGVSGLADWIQDDLFSEFEEETAEDDAASDTIALAGNDPSRRGRRTYAPGVDVVHSEHGRGWVWGSGLGRVTVRFETALTGPGPIHTFAEDDPSLARYEPEIRSDEAIPGSPA